MQPDEKAIELIQKLTKEYALITVDEILWSLNDIDGEYNMGNYIDWWEEVKEEIKTFV